MEENRYYIVKDRKLWEQEDTGIYNSKLENLQITYGIFELIEEQEEIDIESIGELDINEENVTKGNIIDAINDLVIGLKQLDKKIKEM